jgi:zinc protease
LRCALDHCNQGSARHARRRDAERTKGSSMREFEASRATRRHGPGRAASSGHAAVFQAARAMLVVGAIALAGVAAPVRALDPSEISTETLSNGMRVVLWPDHSIPNLAMYTFFRVGSRNERPGITGLSHFFEHMMFLGSKNYKPGEFDQTMEQAGGANNAFTAQDITVYQNWFPRSAMETIFKLEADRIASLAIDSVSVESERGVVASERRRSVEDSNMRLIDEENWAAAYKAHPYQWPVIGWMVDIQGWKRNDLRSYFQMYYAPNNATWVLVGDFDKDEVRALLKKYLEPIPRGPMPLPVTTTEPDQQGERRAEFHKTAELAAFVSSWHIPATASPDYPALRVLESLLLQGESSRLYRRLVDREQAALSVNGGFDYALDPTLFQVFVQVKEGVQTQRCESLLYEEVDRLRQEGPAASEMQKAKNQLAAGFYRDLQTISGKALVLGRSDVYFGDAKAFLKTVDMYEKVTAADVQRVAKTYFTSRNRTVTVLFPDDSPEIETQGAAAHPTGGQ